MVGLSEQGEALDIGLPQPSGAAEAVGRRAAAPAETNGDGAFEALDGAREALERLTTRPWLVSQPAREKSSDSDASEEATSAP